MPIVLYLARRLAVMAGTLVGVSFMIFSLLAIAPGSAVSALLGGRPPRPGEVEALTAKYHLSDPFLLQYWHWIGHALHGDLGRSMQSNQSVTSLFEQKLPLTLELIGLAMLLTLLVGIPAGYVAGVRRNGGLDRAISTVSLFCISAPVFAVGILLSYVFGVQLGWLPVFGAGSGFIDRLSHLALPALALSLGLSAVVARQVRASVMDTMDQDYITFARARGLPRSRIVTHYVLRNSSLPIVTMVGLLAIGMLAGTVLVENVFSVPGLGSQLTGAINSKDILVAQGTALFIAVAVVVINVIVDFAVLVLDPRTRQPRSA
jgi:peptide/nickel transport system permease protein